MKTRSAEVDSIVRRFMRITLYSATMVLSLGVASPASTAGRPLTLERIGSLPHLSGTAPSGPAWSRDSQWLAFVWNDEAMPFRDVWTVSASRGEPKRLTHMGRDFPPSFATSVDFGAAGEEQARRLHGGVSEVVWTPDGRAVIFSFETRSTTFPRTIGQSPIPSGTDDLFRVNADGSELTRLTNSPSDKYSLAFSPDARFLSFLSEGDLWFWSQDTHQLIQATHIGAPAMGVSPLNTCCGPGYSRPDVEISSYQWSPDSRHIAVHVDDRQRMRKILIPDYLGEETHFNVLRRDFPGDNDHVRITGIYSVEQGRLRMLELEDTTVRRISNYGWSPDGSQLLIDENSEDAKDRWIYVVKAEGGPLTEVWHDNRPTRPTQHWNSVWRSDGQGILFISDKDGRHHLYVLSLADRTTQQLTRGDWSVIGESGSAYLAPSSSNREVYFVSNQESPHERHVYRMSESGAKLTRVTSLHGVHHPTLAPDGSKVALLHSNDLTPTELYVVDTREGGGERRLTNSPPKEFHEYSWVQPRYITFPSRIDGVTVHGRLLEPSNLDRTKKYPVIVGPVYPNSVRNRWGDREEWRGLYSTLQQYLTIEGEYINLLVDVRGSVGHGRDFREKLLRDYGGIDIEDIHSGVEYLKTLPYVDPERIGIWGSSYGGLMTSMSLFRKPGVYKAGVASAPATNIGHAMTAQVNVAGRPNTHPEVYYKVSSVNHAEGLQDPLMIIHGMQDDVVLFKDSVTLAEKLMLLGKDFEFVVIPNALHEWSSRDYAALYVLRRLVGHFDRYLGRGPR